MYCNGYIIGTFYYLGKETKYIERACPDSFWVEFGSGVLCLPRYLTLTSVLYAPIMS